MAFAIALIFCAVPASAAVLTCPSLFEPQKPESPKKISAPKVQAETMSDEHIEIDLARDLLTKNRPPEAMQVISESGTIKVHHVERKIQRETVVSKQKYVSVHHRWTPLSRAVKATVLLQHGFSRSHRYFHDMRLLLLSLGFEVIAIDGANTGSTLVETLKLTGKEIFRPSPLDDAMAWHDVLTVENVGTFVAIPHSRGNAVMNLMLASGIYDRRLILYLPLNPYVSWMNDQILDGNRMANETTRAMTNQASIPGMKAVIAQSFARQDPHENVELPIYTQEQAVWQIGYGLMGEVGSKRGFSVLPFYDSKLSLEEIDNGFGLTAPGVVLKPISPRIRGRTRVIVSENDDTTTPFDIQPLLKLLPGGDDQKILIRSENGVLADHHSPRLMPFQVVVAATLEIDRALANPKSDNFGPRKASAFDKTSP